MKKILIVEDNPSDAKLLSFILQKRNYDYQIAADAHQAFDIMGRYPVDLVLLDWQLPSITGLEILRTLRKELRFKNLPVILISGKNEAKHIHTAIKSGASDYIIKPIDPLILDSKMTRLLQKEMDWKFVALPDSESEQATANLKIAVKKLSEVGLELETGFFLPPGTTLEVDLKLLGDLQVPPAQAKVFHCEPSESGYRTVCSLVGMKESDLQKIRLYVRMIQIEHAETGTA